MSSSLGHQFVAGQSPAPGGGWSVGFNIRQTYTHDNANLRDDGRDNWISTANAAHVYPNTFTNGDGVSVDAGMNALYGNWYSRNSDLDNYAGEDARVMGMCFYSYGSAMSPAYFIVDLPAVGDYSVETAGGNRRSSDACAYTIEFYRTLSDADNRTNQIAPYVFANPVTPPELADCEATIHADTAAWLAGQVPRTMNISAVDPSDGKPRICLRLKGGQEVNRDIYLNHFRLTQL